ncbi:hypothetical protein [Salinibaculum salinum]|uniref:hypothetical protein n=1 Tax=Salinibaculum salinum TaxID=3131996 RepID=UPI0030EBBB9E
MDRDWRLVALAVVGLLFTASGIWVAPGEGTTEYTYERAEVSVTSGSLVYERPDSASLAGYNDLAAVDCQSEDEHTRACAFDSYLRERGPVSVSNDSVQIEGYTDQEFVELGGEYYRRVRQGSENGNYVFDVESTDPTAMLDDISQRADEGTTGTWVGVRAAREGEVTSPASPESVSGVGEVYRVDGTDYVVVVTDRTTVDRVPVPMPSGDVLVGLGVVCLFVAALGVSPDRLTGARERR